MLCGWEGNRRSGVAPAMRHRLRGLSTYGLNGLCVGDEHLAYAFGARHLYLYLTLKLKSLALALQPAVLALAFPPKVLALALLYMALALAL